MPPRLTPLRRKLLETLYQLSHSGPVTSARLAEAMGVGRGGVRDHIEALEELGLLEREILGPVTVYLHLTDPALESLGVGYPLLGEIAAGQPILADTLEYGGRIERLEEMLPVEPGDYRLLVRGDSMCGIGICDGDTVFVRPQRWAEDGDIAAVLFPGSNAATLKFFFAEHDRVRLEPANPDFPSMTFDAQQVKVQAVYVCHLAVRGRNRPPSSLRS